MQGSFWVVGVGPGDPELMTLKAISKIKEADLIALPVSKSEESDIDTMLKECTAYQIAVQVVQELEQKEKLFLKMPMIKDKEVLRKIHDEGAEQVAEKIKEGKQIVCLTLGDPSIYSTGMYIHKRIKRMGYQTGMVAGIPSFCAAAARIDASIAENKEEIHILPASYGIEEGLRLPGTKILMKSGRKMPYIKEEVAKKHLNMKMIENCGMETEKIYETIEEIPDKASYFSLMIIKED